MRPKFLTIFCRFMQFLYCCCCFSLAKKQQQRNSPRKRNCIHFYIVYLHCLHSTTALFPLSVWPTVCPCVCPNVCPSVHMSTTDGALGFVLSLCDRLCFGGFCDGSGQSLTLFVLLKTAFYASSSSSSVFFQLLLMKFCWGFCRVRMQFEVFTWWKLIITYVGIPKYAYCICM